MSDDTSYRDQPIFRGWTAQDLDWLFVSLDLFRVPPEERRKKVERIRLLATTGRACAAAVWEMDERMKQSP